MDFLPLDAFSLVRRAALVPFRAFVRDFELARAWRSRTVRLLAGTALLLLVLALGANAVWRWRARSAARVRASEAWAAYSECVLGEPLRAGERPSVRIGRIEMNLPDPDDPPLDAAWPARCAYHLDELHRAVSGGRLARINPALAELDVLAQRAHVDLAPADTPDLADELWAAAAHSGLPVPLSPPHTKDRPAPRPAEPLTVASLPPLPVEIHVAPEEVDHLPADGLRLLFAGPAGDSTLCSFRPDDHGLPFRTAHCADDVVPTATDDRTPGFLRNVKGRFDTFELIRPLLGADPQIISLPAGTEAIGLFSDQLVWVTSGRRILVRTVPQGAAELGPPFDLGEVVGTSPELAACRSESALIVRVRSYDDTASARRAFATVAIRTLGELAEGGGGGWERVPKEVAIQADADFTCRGSEATFTWLDRDVIRQARCTKAGCREEASGTLALLWDSGRANRVSDLDGKAILVGLGMTAGPVVAGSVRTVRMRVAPVREMAHAPDIVVLGDAAHEGVGETDVHVYVRRGAALVLVTSDEPEPFRAVTVASTGAFEPLRVPKL